ncbi:tautomerase family protein [Aliarcobacter butzleri]|uniref:tautomerase family protein n=1 Tax=Aliarcobacter butzleri TaxID=28197 RepID=UPI001EDABEFB|nr:tautomerase family protein [Aliarcobacter butzleri]MCG3688491.1 tautomerase family protein [Aliarcobacter butzleri]MCG3706772.1 tautomerase family protein [Aliarcobacter butzleri]MCT7557319.1 tautomerase family protein [Aliarcobacter butzleri]MCT7557417.1 tautomerase family protein [Aliarcobacter butzleri]MCT7592444.1 tautomerase family protein [Aliarcobacter butzleri]
MKYQKALGDPATKSGKEQKEKLSKGITELFAQTFNGRGASTAVVIIEEVSTDNYSIGGKTISQIRAEKK